MPGNPIQTMIGKLQGRVTPQTQQAIQLQFGVGLHQSLRSQYLSYWSQLFHGNLGESITLSAPVSTVLGQTLPWTVGLLGVSTVISFALGTLVGIALGWRRGSWLDGLLPVSTFFQAVPYFFLGTVLPAAADRHRPGGRSVGPVSWAGQLGRSVGPVSWGCRARTAGREPGGR